MEADGAFADVKQCFSSIQSRKLWAPMCPNACILCPSMDLVVLGVQTTPRSTGDSKGAAENTAGFPAANCLWIHRTMSWQKLASLTFEKAEAIKQATWSPDGRFLALASLNGNVMLYQVESLSNQMGASYGGGGASGGIDPHHTISLSSSGVSGGTLGAPGTQKGILGLAWAHVGNPHPTAWKCSENQAEKEISWR